MSIVFIQRSALSAWIALQSIGNEQSSTLCAGHIDYAALSVTWGVAAKTHTRNALHSLYAGRFSLMVLLSASVEVVGVEQVMGAFTERLYQELFVELFDCRVVVRLPDWKLAVRLVCTVYAHLP